MTRVLVAVAALGAIVAIVFSGLLVQEHFAEECRRRGGRPVYTVTGVPTGECAE